MNVLVIHVQMEEFVLIWSTDTSVTAQEVTLMLDVYLMSMNVQVILVSMVVAVKMRLTDLLVTV